MKLYLTPSTLAFWMILILTTLLGCSGNTVSPADEVCENCYLPSSPTSYTGACYNLDSSIVSKQSLPYKSISPNLKIYYTNVSSNPNIELSLTLSLYSGKLCTGKIVDTYKNQNSIHEILYSETSLQGSLVTTNASSYKTLKKNCKENKDCIESLDEITSYNLFPLNIDQDLFIRVTASNQMYLSNTLLSLDSNLEDPTLSAIKFQADKLIENEYPYPTLTDTSYYSDCSRLRPSFTENALTYNHIKTQIKISETEYKKVQLSVKQILYDESLPQDTPDSPCTPNGLTNSKQYMEYKLTQSKMSIVKGKLIILGNDLDLYICNDNPNLCTKTTDGTLYKDINEFIQTIYIKLEESGVKIGSNLLDLFSNTTSSFKAQTPTDNDCSTLGLCIKTEDFRISPALPQDSLSSALVDVLDTITYNGYVENKVSLILNSSELSFQPDSDPTCENLTRNVLFYAGNIKEDNDNECNTRRNISFDAHCNKIDKQSFEFYLTKDDLETISSPSDASELGIWEVLDCFKVSYTSINETTPAIQIKLGVGAYNIVSMFLGEKTEHGVSFQLTPYNQNYNFNPDTGVLKLFNVSPQNNIIRVNYKTTSSVSK